MLQKTKMHISENGDAYFREQRRKKNTKTQKKRKRKKTKTHKKEDAKKNASLLGHYTKADYKQLFYI